MIRRPPRSTRTDTLFPYTTLFRSCLWSIGSCSTKVGHLRTAPALSPIQSMGLDISTRSIPEPTPNIDLVEIRSEEHTSEIQSLMRISYAVFCLKKKKHKKTASTYTSIKLTN